MTRLALLPVLAAALVLSGCSQLAAIAPVGGNRLSDVRYAANDILVREGVDVLTAPVCTEASDKAVTCSGETFDGDAITVESSADDQTRLTITVGGSVLFEGVIQDVLDEAMRPAS
ncbi:hypothetical protein [Schumannella luteola]